MSKASFVVMSIQKFFAAPDVAAYYLEVIAAGQEDYYLSPGEAPGRWRGRGATALGLAGEVRPEDLRAMLDGVDPRTGAKLVGWRKVVGMDLTLSAPKSVSLLWGLGDPTLTAAVESAHDAAVGAAISYLEDDACVVRRGKEGRIRHAGAGLVSAAFRHRTSRAGDPNLHTHLVTGNLSLGPDGRWTALFTQQLWGHGRTAGFVYQSVLRHELAERLGVSFEPAVKGYGEVTGIDRQVRRVFSQRRVVIEQAMSEHGTTSAHGAQIATLATRPAKPEGMAEIDLRLGWRERADEIGFSIDDVPHPEQPADRVTSDAGLGRLLTDHDATFDRRAVVRAMAEGARQGLTYERIVERTDAFLAGPEVVHLPTGRWSTPEMIAIETDALRLAHGGPRTRAVAATVIRTAVDERPSLSAEQRNAVAAVTATDVPVAVVVGHAGAGKTFALDAARAAWRAAGLEPIGAALAARAARQLETGSGIPSHTIASLLAELDSGRRTLSDRSVVVVDEAGMVGTRDLHRLLTATSSARAKLVLVGDPKQLSEIKAGGLYAVLGHHLGAAELSENRRMRAPAQAATARALRDRKVERALLGLRRTGSLTVLDNAEHLRDRIAEDWHLEHRDGKYAVMLAPHRSDVDDLNRRARQRLIDDGSLSAPLLSIDDVEFAAGDRVIALRNRRRLGLLNGTCATVVGRSADGLRVTTDEGRHVDVPMSYLLDGHMTHGYATTIHKSQGMTCDVALLLGGDSLNTEAGYTAITRGRLRNHVYVVAAHDGDALADLRKALATSSAKSMATEPHGLAL